MWSTKYSQCLECKTSEIPHKAKGLCKRCYEESKDYIWQKNYVQKNKDKIRKYRKENPGLSQRKIWMHKISERDGNKCKICDAEDNLQLEHKMPKCIGGKYSYENLEILCRRCNRNQWNKLVKKALKLYFEL